MVRKIFTIAIACLVASASYAEVPRILIIQRKDKATENFDPNVKIASILASELDEEGRVDPIVWGLTDPVFRKALEQQLLMSPPDQPTVEYAVSALSKFKAEYIVFVKAISKQDGVDVECELYKGSRQIWKDKNSILYGGTSAFDKENAARTAARTWALKMSGEPFKDLPPKPKQGTPDPENSRQTLTNVSIPPPITRKVDNSELKTQINQMLGVGRISTAVNLLRDAVDAEPLDAERRMMLVSALMQILEPSLAAGEAHRGAVLFPEVVNFRVLAARAHLMAGNIDEATQEINEAVARDANAPEIRQLMGEISLKGLRYEAALQHFDIAIQKAPTADAYFKRALAKAMMANLSGCQEDLAEAAKLEPSPTATTVRERYDFAASLIDAMVDQTATDIRGLIQRTRLNAKEQNLPVECSLLLNRTAAITQIFSKLSVPKAHTNSNNIRILALKLLAQCLGDVKGSFGTLNEDVLTDATINLGEALKSYAQAKETYLNEREAGDKSGQPTG